MEICGERRCGERNPGKRKGKNKIKVGNSTAERGCGKKMEVIFDNDQIYV